MSHSDNWLNKLQLRKRMTIEQLAKYIDRPIDEVRAAIYSKRAPIEWQVELSDRRARGEI